MISFSVVTPTLNQAKYINKTIQSVIDQKYSEFEHIIVDGESSDGTVEILKKYPHLKWSSEKDRGRSDALNKGFARARCDIIAWINSDDYYLPGAFFSVARFFEQNPDAKIIVGRARVVDAEGQFLFDQDEYPSSQLHFEGLLRFWRNRSLPQPSLFFKKEVLDVAGEFDAHLHDYPDYDLVLRLSRKFKIYSTSDFYSCICIQDEAGSVRDIAGGVLEKKLYSVSRPYWKYLSRLEYAKIFLSYYLAYPFILWRASYESFAFKNKTELKRSWIELKPAAFLKKHAGLFFSHPAHSIWASLGFFFKLMKKRNHENRFFS